MRNVHEWLQDCPQELLATLADVSKTFNADIYFTGGVVRDWLLGNTSFDYDITVSGNGLEIARHLAKVLGAAYVLLDEHEKVARVVWRKFIIDIASFRQGTNNIHDDLLLRDFTMNALAIQFDPQTSSFTTPLQIIDPANGRHDLNKRIIRATSDGVFDNDPLRMLRAYRFKATFGFEINPETEAAITDKTALLGRVASERIMHELQKIIEADRAADSLNELTKSGLLWEIFPELHAGVGLEQPASHHLDVFNHAIAALGNLEFLLVDMARYFPNKYDQLQIYINKNNNASRLKWAALFHDLGKPTTFDKRASRVTFYNHDKAGAQLFKDLGRRLRFSNEDIKCISRFIEHHMWPFHLNNARRKQGISAKACLRLAKVMEDDLPGLFVLAMADSLAGCGKEKPAGMEKSLADLYDHIDAIYQKSIKPVIEQPKLLSGHDLQDIFSLTPGPLFKRIFMELEQAQVAGRVVDRHQAISWVKAFLKNKI